MKARTDSEKRFERVLQATFPELYVEVDFTDGRCGLEDMSFPYWYISIKKPDGTREEKYFGDKLRYLRSFGDTSFTYTEEHYKDACEWLKNFSE